MDLLGIGDTADLDGSFPFHKILLHVSVFCQLRQRICKYLSHSSPLPILLRLAVLLPVMAVHGMVDPFLHCLHDRVGRFLYCVLHDLSLALGKMAQHIVGQIHPGRLFSHAHPDSGELLGPPVSYTHLFETVVDCDIDAFIPDGYIKNEYLKLDVYKRISAIENEEEYMDMQDELCLLYTSRCV